MRSVDSAAEHRVVLKNISWSTYVGLVTDSDDRHSRIAYDRGLLEIMSPSQRHEQLAAMICRLIEAFTEELRIPVRCVRSTTFMREDQERGFEADASYYVANVGAVLHNHEIDLMVNPPPDLCIEVDISRSSVGKLEIYRSLGVPEVWRHTGESIHVHVLRDDGTYGEAERSAALPQLLPGELTRFLERMDSEDDTRLVRSFRAWVRERFGIA